MQLDKSSNVANCAQLIVHGSFIQELGVQEESLFGHPLPARAAAATATLSVVHSDGKSLTNAVLFMI